MNILFKVVLLVGGFEACAKVIGEFKHIRCDDDVAIKTCYVYKWYSYAKEVMSYIHP